MINNWQHETDVIVIGAGLAGYRAALAAAEAGAQVLLLEKQPEPGGSSVLSSGFLAFAGTDLQATAGIADSNERLFDDLRNAGGGRSEEGLLQVYIRDQLETYSWLRQLGMTFKPVQLSSAQSVPRTHPLEVQVLLQRLAAECEKSGRVRMMLNSPARRLLQDLPQGRVTGVLVETGGAEQSMRARRGVVVAAGGFTRNEQMLNNFVPHQAKGVRFGGAGNTGDGIRMAWALGADLQDMAMIKGTFGFHPNARTQPGRDWTKLPFYQGAIIVNNSGRRFVDESKSYKLLGDAVLQQQDAIAFQIFDEDIMDRSVDRAPPFDFRSAHRRGLVESAPTIRALAHKIGMPSDVLGETVRRYNEFAERGCDPDFGRDGLGTHYGKLVAIRRAPFYAYASTSGLLATYCGLSVTSETEVLDVFGEKIDALYAAGELMGGFHGESYMTGTALGKCLIFGRIAGLNAARHPTI